MSAGKLAIGVQGAPLREHRRQPARRLTAVLAERGALHAYREFPSGHNWYTWRIGLAEGLLDLLGGDLWGV